VTTEGPAGGEGLADQADAAVELVLGSRSVVVAPVGFLVDDVEALWSTVIMPDAG
jgi:hypothetical protein